MRILRVVVIAALFYCFLQTNISAQQGAQANQAPTGLALEVTYFKGTHPAYQVVPNNSWYGYFQHIGAGNSTAGAASLPVQAVCVGARMEGTGVRVVVSVYLGEKFFEKQEPVGSYLLRENEKLAVNELTAFGVAPFELAVVRVAPKSGALPAFTNNTRSVQLLNAQPVDSTFPGYRLTLLNTSGKDIIALYIETFVNGKRRTSSMPRNQDGTPLIAAGATYEYKRELNNEARRTTTAGYSPETPPNQTVFIKTAIFEDGTYEGDPSPAAEYRAFRLGEKQQFEQLLALFRSALESSDSNAVIRLDTLRSEVSALGIDVEQAALNKLLSDFASLPENERRSLKEAAELLMFESRKDALKEIDDFRKKQGASLNRESLHAWLSESLDRFQKRLDRLQKL